MSYSRMQSGNILTDLQSATADRIGGVVERMGPSGRMLAQRSREITDEVQSSLVDAMQARPLATVAAVAVISFALGALWRR